MGLVDLVSAAHLESYRPFHWGMYGEGPEGVLLLFPDYGHHWPGVGRIAGELSANHRSFPSCFIRQTD